MIITRDQPLYESELDDDSLKRFFSRSLQASCDWFEDIYKSADLLWKAYAGTTLSDRDKKYLRYTGREPIDWNLSLGTINLLLGIDQTERKEARFEGVDTRGPHDAAVAEALTRVVRHFMQRCNGPQAESMAFLDALIGGYGFNERFLDTTKPGFPPTAKYVPFWEVFPDPDAIEPGLLDAKFWIRRRRYAVDNAQAMWPDKWKEISQVHVSDTTPKSQGTPSIAGVFSRTASVRANARPEVIVYDFQYVRYVPVVVFEDPVSGERIEQTEEEFEKRKSALTSLQETAAADLMEIRAAKKELSKLSKDDPQGVANKLSEGDEKFNPISLDARERELTQNVRDFNPDNIRSFRRSARRYYRAHIVGGVEGGDYSVLTHKEIKEQCYTYSAVTGYFEKDQDQERVRFFGPMETLLSSQLALNRAAVTIHETLGRGAKGGGGFIEKSGLSSITTPDEFAKQVARPGAWVVVEDGTIGQNKIKEMRATPMPQGVTEYIQLCRDMLQRISLVTDGLKGTLQNERSNVLVSNQQQQALTGLSQLYDSLAIFRVTNGRVMASMVHRYVLPRDIDEICADMEVVGLTHQEVPDPATGKMVKVPIPGVSIGELLKKRDPQIFDVAANQGPSSPTHKQAMWQILHQTNLLPQLMEILGPAMQKALPLLIKNMPVETNLAAEIARAIEMGMEQHPIQPQQQPGGAQ